MINKTPSLRLRGHDDTFGHKQLFRIPRNKEVVNLNAAPKQCSCSYKLHTNTKRTSLLRSQLLRLVLYYTQAAVIIDHEELRNFLRRLFNSTDTSFHRKLGFCTDTLCQELISFHTSGSGFSLNFLFSDSITGYTYFS